MLQFKTIIFSKKKLFFTNRYQGFWPCLPVDCVIKSSGSFDLSNSMIQWSRWSVNLRWMFEYRCYIHPYMILLIAEIITQSLNLLRDIPDRTCYWYIRSGWQESQAGLLPKKSWSVFLCFSQLLLFCCVWCPPNFCQRKELFGFLCER